jgi:hypothetical protein
MITSDQSRKRDLVRNTDLVGSIDPTCLLRWFGGEERPQAEFDRLRIPWYVNRRGGYPGPRSPGS